jgi:hypothetical protein
MGQWPLLLHGTTYTITCQTVVSYIADEECNSIAIGRVVKKHIGASARKLAMMDASGMVFPGR